MRSITRVVVHCSATPNGVWISPEQIDAWHRERGFSRDAVSAKKFRPHLPSIAFHRIVQVDGSIAFGCDLEEEVGLNPGTVAICMVGTRTYFARQWDGLREALCILTLGLAERIGHRVDWTGSTVLSPEGATRELRLMGVSVVGHRDLPSPEAFAEAGGSHDWLRVCPGFDVRAWLDKGMEPEAGDMLDGHPAIAQADPASRVMSSMRYGALS